MIRENDRDADIDLIEKDVKKGKAENYAQSKRSIMLIILIVVSILIFAIVITLLVGHFKYNWFKEKTKEIEQANDIPKLSRIVNQINYFTEIKTINTRVEFTQGSPEYTEQKINTNFVVMQTDRKELRNNDFLNNATLVILEANAIIRNETRNITSFNIFDESIIEEFKSNPNGTKYPMSLFSFYENGTLANILLPNDIDNYNANLIIELIEDVIPKLSRNKTEDANNGIKFESKQNSKKFTLVESQSPKEIKEFKGSKYTKLIEREIEEEKLTNAKTYSNLLLANTKDESKGNFGLQNFQYDSNSEIKLTGIKDGKKNAGLFKDLAKYYTFISSEELFEKKKQTKEYVIDEREIDIKDSQINNLNDEISDIITVKEFDVYGAIIAIKIKVGLKEGKGFCQVIIESELGLFSFGPEGVDGEISLNYDFEDTIISYKFPPFPAVGIDLKVAAFVDFSLAVCSYCDHYVEVSFKGDLNAALEINAGWDSVASVAAGVQGTICSTELNGYLNRNYILGGIGSFSGGAVTVYVKATLLGFTVLDASAEIWDGWTYTFDKQI